MSGPLVIVKLEFFSTFTLPSALLQPFWVHPFGNCLGQGPSQGFVGEEVVDGALDKLGLSDGAGLTVGRPVVGLADGLLDGSGVVPANTSRSFSSSHVFPSQSEAHSLNLILEALDPPLKAFLQSFLQLDTLFAGI